VFETKGQKQEPKMRGQSGSLKINSFLYLHFFSSMSFFSLCFFSLLLEKKKMLGESA
jgi:hypothetical protein